MSERLQHGYDGNIVGENCCMEIKYREIILGKEEIRMTNLVLI